MGARTRGLANNVLTGGKIDATDGVSGVIDEANIANASLTSATTFGSVSGGVPAVASDPSPAAEGDIWYNTTVGKLRFVAKVASWATGGNLNLGRNTSGFGTTGTAGAVVAGEGGSPVADRANHEQYDGTSWTELADVPTARQSPASGGTQTAGIQATGYHGTPGTRDDCYEWDGSSWTTIDNTPAEVYDGECIGTVSAMSYVTTGEILTLPTAGKEHYNYNGTAWTDLTDLSSTHVQGSGIGTTTSAVLVASGRANTPGAPSVRTAVCEVWDGSSWTEVGDMNTARSSNGAFGTTTEGYVCGGNLGPSRVAQVESWDGTSWTETSTDLSSPATSIGSNTTSTTDAFIAGGPPSATRTEEFTLANTTTVVG